MNSEFEKKLMEQRLRQTPPAWRAEILREARGAMVQEVSAATGWRSWLWPTPKAWAALAACWLVLLAVNTVNQPERSMRMMPTDAKAMAMALAEKRRTLQDAEVLVAHRTRPDVSRLAPGSNGWVRRCKGALPC